MPLVLTLHEGSSFTANGQLITVERVEHDRRLYVRVEGSPKLHEVTDKRATEVLPNVMLSAGIPVNHRVIRLAIEAPRSIAIVRTPKAKAK